MRIIVMGTGSFAVPMFQAILADGHDVPAVVTRPITPPHGRKQPPPNPVREAARQQGITILDPPNINDDLVIDQLSQLHPELLVVCDFGQILRSAVLAVAPLGGINLHGSLLPKYRGAAPVQWAIMNGDDTTGVTVIRMTPKLDGGPALCQLRIPIDPHETAPELEQRLALSGAPVVIDAIQMLARWDGEAEIGTLQDNQLVTQAPRLDKQHGHITWDASTKAIINLHRGLQPWPGCYTHWLRKSDKPLRLIIKRLEVAKNLKGIPGTVLQHRDATGAGSLLIATGDGCVAITQVQPEGKRVMEADEFLRGYPLRPGEKLG